MILEVAEIHIIAGQNSAFEAAVSEGVPTFAQTDGYIRHQLQQSIEEPTRYLLLIHWESVEAHTVNFRESERFPQWRALISPFFAKPPYVQHFEVRNEGP